MNDPILTQGPAEPTLIAVDRTPLVIALAASAALLVSAPAAAPILVAGTHDAVLVVEKADPPSMVLVGTPGPPGAKGDQGEPGIAQATYTHQQTTASDVWTINHNLGVRPVIALVTDGGYEFDAEVKHLSVNTAVATMTIPLTGTARCT